MAKKENIDEEEEEELTEIKSTIKQSMAMIKEAKRVINDSLKKE